MTTEQTRLIKVFDTEYARFLSVDPHFFYKEHLGQLGIKPLVEPIFSGLKEKLAKTKSVIADLQYDTTSNLNGILNEINNYLSTISSLAEDDYIKDRYTIIDSLSVLHNKFLGVWEKIAGLYSDAIISQEQFEKIFATFKERGEDEAKQITALRKDLEDKLKNFDDRYGEIYSKAEFAKQERRFLQTADFNNNQSKIWMRWIIALTGALTIVSIYFISSCWIVK